MVKWRGRHLNWHEMPAMIRCLDYWAMAAPFEIQTSQDICEGSQTYKCRVNVLQAQCVCRTTNGSVIAGSSAEKAVKSLSVLMSSPKHSHSGPKIVELASYLAVGLFNEGNSPLLMVMNEEGIVVGRQSFNYAEQIDNQCVSRQNRRSSLESNGDRNGYTARNWRNILTFSGHYVAAVSESYRYRIVACLVPSSSPIPLKTRRVGQRCTLNLSRAETSSRWCGVVVRRGGDSSGVVHVT
ncbi:uncharacterized protein TNCV_1598991 [Trichonephila clavipes]|nr:uncharacterized protein TNCV_1598991 [Trichonephila clavipes]